MFDRLDIPGTGRTVVGVGLLLLAVSAGVVAFQGTVQAAEESGSQATSETLTTQTTWNPGEYFTATVTYSVDAEMRPRSISPGGPSTWEVELTNSRVAIEGSVSLGSENAEFDTSTEVPIGESQDVPIPGTSGLVSATVQTGLDVEQIQVDGPGRATTSRLAFDRTGVETFTVMVSEDASVGDTLTVSGRVVPLVELGLQEDVPVVGPGELTRQDIDAPAFPRPLQSSATVGQTGGVGQTSEVPAVPLLFGGLLVAVGVYVVRYR